MLTLNNHEVWRTLKEIAEEAFPENKGKIKAFRVSIHAIESRTKHGDYSLLTREIRIFNLSRKTAHIIKTTIHELAHHCDCSFYGTTAHDKQFYITYKRLLEIAHRMGKINLADTADEIDSRDLSAMVKKVGAPQFEAQARRSGHLIKVDNAFAIKDLLKEHGYRYSSTEKLWLMEVLDGQLEEERRWVEGKTQQGNIKIVGVDDNAIESIYFGIIGKKFFGKNDELKTLGFRYDSARGWYKRIRASEKDEFSKLVRERFKVAPSFTGTL